MKLLAILLTVGACATHDDPVQHFPKTNKPSFTLYVSNQSYENTVVDMQVFIDGRRAVSGDFETGSQHTWHEFHFELAPGPHAIRVQSADVDVVQTLDTTTEGKRYGILQYFTEDADNVQEHQPFGFQATNEQPLFL